MMRISVLGTPTNVINNTAALVMNGHYATRGTPTGALPTTTMSVKNSVHTTTAMIATPTTGNKSRTNTNNLGTTTNMTEGIILHAMIPTTTAETATDLFEAPKTVSGTTQLRATTR